MTPVPNWSSILVQRQELLYDKGQSHFEGTVVRGSNQQDLDVSLLQSYADAVRHPDPTRLLLAGACSAAAESRRWARSCSSHRSLRCGSPRAPYASCYRGRERGSGPRQQLLADRRIDGPIPHQFAAAREQIRELLPSRRALVRSGRFENVGLIPEDAWLEGLVNAVVHRSYSISGDHTRVEIFDDRIEIESPGRFPGLADPSDPLHVTRFARNPRIARVCSDLDFGQELGEGIRRMFEEMQLAGLSDPSYRQTSGSTRLTLVSTPVDRALEERLPARVANWCDLSARPGEPAPESWRPRAVDLDRSSSASCGAARGRCRRVDGAQLQGPARLLVVAH